MEPEQTPIPDGVSPCPDASAGLELIVRGAGLLQSAPTSVLSAQELRETVAAVAQARSRLDAGYLHLLASLDARDEAVPGASVGKGGATFLIHRMKVSPGQAAREVRLAHALDVDGGGISPQAGRDADPAGPGLPRMGGALAAGEVTLGHAQVAVRCLSRLPDRYLTTVAEDGLSGAARVDAFLTEHARSVSPEVLSRIAQHLLAALLPQDDTYAKDTYERRYLSMGTDPTGMIIGSFALDPAAGARFRAVIEAIVKTQRLDPSAGLTPEGADGQGDRQGDGQVAGEQQETLPLRDERSAGQRRADALDQLCHDAIRGVSGSAAGAQVVVVATPGQLADALAAQPAPLGPDGTPLRPPSTLPDAPAPHPGEPGAAFRQPHPVSACGQDPCGLHPTGAGEDGPGRPGSPGGPNRRQRRSHQRGHRAAHSHDGGARTGPVATGLAVDISSGSPIEASTLALYLCTAVLTGIALDDNGAVLAHGRTRRFATPAQLRALTARDQGCVAPGCGLPPSRCDAHHVIWWRNGGRTDITNLVLLCPRHHAAVHAGIWQLHIIDGVPWLIPPRWADPTRTPRRNSVPNAYQHARALSQQLRDTQLTLDLDLPDGGAPRDPDEPP